MTDNLEQSISDNTSIDTTNNTLLNTVNNTTINSDIPDKFKVTGEDGSIDYQATLSKMNDSYAYLEKRVGTSDLPPKTEDEYSIEREGFDFNEFKKDESNNSFLKSAHAQGITNKQLDFLLTEYDKRAIDLVSNNSQLDTDTAVNTLQTEWGKDYESNIFNAVKAARSAGLTEEHFNDPSIGNNVAVIKALAYFGSQLQEDRATSNGVPVKEDIQTLLRSDALHDPRHPEHKATKERIDVYYNSLRR
ncbi:hypothetical protein [Acinetobacter bereziniae]|jgi:hypothetical protein|uniref:hypothetical protein n=1 Tax=Acinetobacter bereziniae TaxID=106648 RepID=UPI0019017BCF|nr:hypothetical protein [Acinetobacter bereziniae]MBJ8445886.1 hypothetical protein [Acinetobacter bereziniae]